MLDEIISEYLKKFPEENSRLDYLVKQIQAGEKMNDRRNFHGHVTGSAVVLSPDKKQVLLIDHRHFKLWQQPGGHWEDDDPNPFEAAQRELEEETKVKIKKVISVIPDNPLVPLDIDTHKVPARPEKDEPEHWHHDFRYLFLAADTTLSYQKDEVAGAAWYDIDDPITYRIADPIRKLHELHIVP